MSGGGETAGPPPQPLLHLEFSGGAGSDAVDSSGNGFVGTYNGDATPGGAGWDDAGTGLLLDGSRDYVEIPDDPAFQLQEGAISIRLNADNLILWRQERALFTRQRWL